MTKIIKIYFRATIIVALITLNMYFISKGKFSLSLLTNAGIALVWTLNIRDLSVSNWSEKISYILGSTTGAFISLYYLRKIFV